jgi:hypothetical protein
MWESLYGCSFFFPENVMDVLLVPMLNVCPYCSIVVLEFV